MDYMNIVRWDNEYMKNYDKVIKELKEKFKIKENYNKVLNQLKNLNWIKVNPEKNYNQKINTFFDETDDILSTKIVKYKNIIKKLEFKKTYNTNIKQKALDKSLLVKTCPVCYDDNFESYAITRCGHTFCTNCIKKCISSQFKCPLCRGILFFKDVSFFNKSEYNFIYKHEFNLNTITDHPFNEEHDIVYIPPQSSIILRNSRSNSIIIDMKNITGNLDQYNFEEYLDYDQFKKIISYIESNIKSSYDKKYTKMISLLFQVISSRRNITETVLPNSIDEPESVLEG